MGPDASRLSARAWLHGLGPAPEAREEGVASVWVIMLAFVLIMLAGLIYDGGSALNQRAKAADDVEQAARAGAAQLDIATLRGSGVVAIDPGAADQAARAYLTAPQLGYPAGTIKDVQVTPTTVTVEVDTTYSTKLLKMMGITTFPITARATARAATGIDAETPP